MSEAETPRVLHVITGLYAGGGAETLLVRMLEELEPERRQGHGVISLRPRGPLADAIEALGVPVDALGMGGLPTPRDPGRVRDLAVHVRRSGAEVVQTWMLHSNVLAGLTARLASSVPVVWGVHVSEVNRATLGTKAVIVQRVEALTSWFVPARVIACSLASREAMHRLPYRRSRIVTIPNGFDVDRFRPDPADRASVREELGLGPETVAIGHVARFHPIKGHATLIEGLTPVLAARPEARLFLCGYGVGREDPELARLVEPLGESVCLLGSRGDVPRLLNGFDLAVSSSYGEALPLAIGEAMATGLPVVATDAGDSAELVGGSGEIVPIRDAGALGAAVGDLLDRGPEARAELGRQARLRIAEEYSMATMVARYADVWREVRR